MIKGLNNSKLITLIFICTIYSGIISGQKRFKLPELLHENSGLIYLNKDSCWWHNDSGNGPELFLTNDKGASKNTVRIDAINTDWEDFTIDNANNFYIGDFGNNALKRIDFSIYKYNPVTNKTDSINFKYGNEENKYDCEAFVWQKSELHLFTKGINDQKNYECAHFTINDNKAKQQAHFVEKIDLKPYVVTGASISPDGKMLALLSYRYKFLGGFIPDTDSRIYFFKVEDGTIRLTNQMIGYYTIHTWFFTRQYESIDYINNNELMLGAERTSFLRPMIRKIKIPKKFR